MMEIINAIEHIEKRSNRSAKVLYWVPLCFCLISTLAFGVYMGGSINTKIAKIMFTGPLLTPLWFMFAAHRKKNGYKTFRRWILADWINKRFHSDRHIIFVFFRVFLSISFYSTIISLGIYMSLLKIYPNIFPEKLLGTLIVYCTMVFLTCYGVIALPRMIALKTGNHKLKYFYWLQFIKALFTNSPLMYLSIGLFLIISFIISRLTYTYTYTPIGNTLFSIKNAFEMNQFGVTISVIGIWLSIAIILVQDFIKSYSQINKTYENYTTHILRERIINGGYFQYILIGMGSLGRIVGGYMVSQIVKRQEQNHLKKHPLALFECIVDRDLKFRIIPRSIVIIEKDQTLFEETRVDTNNGLTFGFVNGKDMSYEMSQEHSLSGTLAVFCLNGNGGYLPILKLSDYEGSRVIINTTSDPDMGFKLKMIMEREGEKDRHPVIISTVEDSSTYSYLEGNSKTTIFPLHAGLSEGNSIAVRLFMMIRNMVENKCSIKDIELYLAGTSRTLYYILLCFTHFLKQCFNETQIKQLLEEQLIVITNEELILDECDPTPKNERYRYLWNILLNNKEPYKIRLIFQSPTKIHSLHNAAVWTDLKPTGSVYPQKEYLFVFTTKNAHDAFRMCQHAKQIANVFQLKRLGILASVSVEIYREIETMLEQFQPLINYLNQFKGFPSYAKDVILKKNLIIGSQIISISDCLRDKEYFDSRENQSSTESTFENDHITGEIALCLTNTPGALCKTLADISGLSGFELPHINGIEKEFPSFFNNYAYTQRLKDFGDKETFVFRGDAFLSTPNDPSSGCVNRYLLNGTPNFQKEAAAMMYNLYTERDHNCNTCNYNPRCPISTSIPTHEPTEKNLDTQGRNGFATIKILADGDDLPGSLAIALSDFLMAGTQLHFAENVPTDGYTDIVYENCTICHNHGKLINRLYVKMNQKIDPELAKRMTERINHLLTKRNIIGVKIKPSKGNHTGWENYATELKSYLETISGRSFDMHQDTEITLFDRHAEGNEKEYIIREL